MLRPSRLLFPLTLFVAFIVYGLTLAYASVDAGVAPVVAPVAPLVVKAAFNWAPFIPLFAVGLGSFGAWLKAWTPSTGFFHTVYGHAAVMLAVGVLAAGGSWLASGQLDKASLLNGVLGAATAWLAGLKPNGSDSDVGILGKDKTEGAVVKAPTATGGAA